MLKLKVKASEKLQMPESVLTGKNTTELLDPYLIASPVAGKYTTLYGRYRRTARYTDVPLWGIERGKSLQNCAFIIDNWVKLGLAEWIEFHEDEFDPRKAIIAIRSVRLNRGPRTEAHSKAISAAMKKKFEEMSEEEKLAWNAAKSAGWKKKKEKESLDKKTQRKINSGRVIQQGDVIPEWMNLSEGKIVK